MNKLEGNLVLLSIAFFWGVQYVFFRGLPPEISTFAFMTLTYGIGFLLLCAVFWRELRKITLKLVKQSLLLSVLVLASNTLMTYGSRFLDPSVSGFLATTYILFVPLVLALLREKLTAGNLTGTALAVCGLLLATGFGFTGDLGGGVVPMLLSNGVFALYLVAVDRAAGDANPALLSMGQMAFSTVFALLCWLVVQPSTLVSLPRDTSFWSAVLFIALFIRAFTTVTQIYAQRYVSAMNASLVLSGETVFALLTGPLLAPLLGTEASPVTPLRAVGCVVLVCGVLVSSGVIRLPKRKEAVAK